MVAGHTWAAGGIDDVIAITNSQVPGASHEDKWKTWQALCKRWRLAYLSVTVYQDAPGLANQGMLCASQAICAPAIFNPSMNAFGVGDGTAWLEVGSHVAIFGLGDIPRYSRSQSMPNAYFGKAQEGLYMPLKLTRTSQEWRSASDAYGVGANSGQEETSVGSFFLPETSAAGMVGFPFVDLERAWVEPAPWNYPPLTGTNLHIKVTSPLCNDMVGHISMQGSNASTTFKVFVRSGWELQVQPGTILTPHQKLSPQYDPTALRNYFQISREMKDGFPSDYNDLGEILGHIGEIASVVGPAIGMIPHPAASNWQHCGCRWQPDERIREETKPSRCRCPRRRPHRGGWLYDGSGYA